MILSTNNLTLRKACPFLSPHKVVYGHTLYGDRKRPMPITESPKHSPVRAINLIEIAKRVGGRTLIDIEFKGNPIPNADGVEVDSHGEWSFHLVDRRANPEQRWEEVYNYHRDIFLTLHTLSPTTEIGWWMTPRDDYKAYRELAFTGASDEVDRLREITDRVIDWTNKRGPIMDFAAVVHYIDRDELGEGKVKFGGDGMSWSIRADILNAKVETAKLFGVPIVVYVNPVGLAASDIETYLQPIADHPDVDECVVWRPDHEVIDNGSPLAEGLRFFQGTRLG